MSTAPFPLLVFYYLVWPFPIFFIITMHVYRFLFFVITLCDRFLSFLLLPCMTCVPFSVFCYYLAGPFPIFFITTLCKCALFPLFVSSIMCTGYWVCFITLCTVTTVCYYYLVYCYHCLLLLPCVLLPLFVISTLCTASLFCSISVKSWLRALAQDGIAI